MDEAALTMFAAYLQTISEEKVKRGIEMLMDDVKKADVSQERAS